MYPDSALSTADVLAAFSDEISAHGGRLTDHFDDGRRLFARSVLARDAEVGRRDKVRGGVAVKATSEEVWLYPYVYRLVCKNGAILAETFASRHLADLTDPESALRSIREGVGACCAEEVFLDSVQGMRAGRDVDADLALMMVSMLTRLPGGHRHVASRIMRQFFRERDTSRFGLANAITATARDTTDPELRWDLEELGGGIAIGIAPSQPTEGGVALAEPLDCV